MTPEELLDSVTDAVIALDRHWRYTYLNKAAEAWRNTPRGTVLGQVLWDVFPELLGTPWEAAYRRAMDERVPGQLESRYRDDRWAQVRIFPSADGIVIYIHDTTEERRARQSLHDAEDALRASEARWRTLIEESSDSIAVLSPDGHVIYGSPAFRRLLGYEPGELATRDSLELIHPDDLPGTRALLARILSVPGAAEPSELRYLHKAGHWVRLAITARNLVHDPSIRGVVCNSRDITAERALEEQLRASERRLRDMFEAAPFQSYVWQREGDTFVLSDFNEEAARQTGGRIHGFLGQRLEEFYADDPRLPAFIRRAAAQPNVPQQEEFDYVMRADNSRRRVAATFTAPTPDLVLVHSEDLTEKREAEALFEGISEQSIAGIYVHQHGRFVYANPPLAAMLGYDMDELLEKRGFEWLVHPDDRAFVEEETRARLAGERKFSSYIHRVFRKDGTILHVEIHGSSIKYRGETALIGTVLDVTERRRALQALAESERRFRGFLENLRAIALILDREGRVEFANDHLLALTGYSREEIGGLAWGERFLPPDDARMGVLFHEAMRSGQIPAHMENEILTRDGKRRLVSWDNVIIRDAEGNVTGSASIGHDVTQQRELEAQLRQAQKMEAVGRLAGGVAHDFNNLLTVIQANAEFLAEDVPEGSDARHEVSEIARASSRAAMLTRQLLAFSRRQMLQRQELDLNDTVSEMVRMLRRLIGEHIDLELALEPAVARILADPGQVEQVIVNLAVNARDAMPDGGRLCIGTATVDLGPEYAERHAMVPAGRYVRLTVSDTGHGMDREVLARIFEPFFTTKPAGQGTGLGLSTVYGIVKQSDGFIWPYSEPGAGSTFKVYFPIDKDLAAHDSEAKPGGSEGRGRETVLLTEDEEAVRTIARRLLQRLGYQVLEAANGREALEIARGHRGEIHLLLTDLVMPEMGGRELAEALVRERTEMRVLFMSGYTDDEIVRRGMLDGQSAMLEKPFSTHSLGHAVREALDS